MEKSINASHSHPNGSFDIYKMASLSTKPIHLKAFQLGAVP